MKTSKWIISLAAAAFLFTAGAAIADDKSDWMVDRDVKHALLAKLGADALRIDVNSTDGNVNLLGTVGKRETKELASTIAKSSRASTSSTTTSSLPPRSTTRAPQAPRRPKVRRRSKTP